MTWLDRDPADLRRVLMGAHDRGWLDVDALLQACEAHRDRRQPVTREALIAIFGALPIYHLLTTRDETAHQLVREAFDLLTNGDSTVDLRLWTRAAELVVGPIHQDPARD
jgi:hypothetical protein